MKPVHNWRTILRHAWSVRFMALGTLFAMLETALPLIDEIVNVPPGLFLTLTMISMAGSFVSRFIHQATVSGDER